jgi:hypothetical protein
MPWENGSVTPHLHVKKHNLSQPHPSCGIKLRHSQGHRHTFLGDEELDRDFDMRSGEDAPRILLRDIASSLAADSL